MGGQISAQVMADDQIVKAAMNEAILAYRGEVVRRRRVEVPIAVFEAKTNDIAPDFPGGSMIVTSGLAKAPFMQAMRSAAQQGDARAIGALLLKHRSAVESAGRNRGISTPTNITERIGGVSVLSEISYRGKALADGLPVIRELPATAVLLPFAGGPLDEKSFVASHFVTLAAPATTDLDTVIIYRQPQLTPLEKRILEMLPNENIATSVGSVDQVANWGLVAAAVVFVAAVVVGVYFAQQATKELQQNQQDQQAAVDNVGQDQQQADQQQGQADLQQAGQQQGQGDQQQGQGDQQQGQGDQQQGQGDQQQGQGDQQQGQGDQQQGQGDQQQGQGDQQQGQGDQQVAQENNGGSIIGWIDQVQNQVLLEGLNASAAVATLVQVRTQMMRQGAIR